MDEIDAMKAISEKLEKLSDDERERVLAWTLARFSRGGQPPPIFQSNVIEKAPSGDKIPKKSAAKPKTSKKSKTVISMDKGLNLTPPGKKSALQFATEKKPANVMQKCVVSIYYLRDTIGLGKVNVSSVYTFFKTLGWPLPSDLKNTLQQAGSKGWLDTADGEDIKLTSMGENLVEHSLPPKSA